MKTLLVLLYLMNPDGGEPVLVRQFDTMPECIESAEKSITVSRGGRWVSGKLVCIPIMREN